MLKLAGFANEGQFLAISLASLQDVNKRLADTAAAKRREAVQAGPASVFILNNISACIS